MDVTWWIHDEEPPAGGGHSIYARWNCSLDADPQVNATGLSMAHMQELFVGRYNEVHGATVTAADFTWNETAPPVPEALTVDPA